MKLAALIAAAITLAAQAASAQDDLIGPSRSRAPAGVFNAMPPAQYQAVPVPGYQPYHAPPAAFWQRPVPPPPGPVLLVPHGGGYYSFTQ
jgi:acetyl esterase/lipase